MIFEDFSFQFWSKYNTDLQWLTVTSTLLQKAMYYTMQIGRDIRKQVDIFRYLMYF